MRPNQRSYGFGRGVLDEGKSETPRTRLRVGLRQRLTSAKPERKIERIKDIHSTHVSQVVSSRPDYRVLCQRLRQSA